ncbi:MAG: beta-ketoacyl-[acyl-carrier-protein] synthase II, partial [Phycisphaerae bacterium]|nr:beta-ketoacyl-[acyl-carrier-protein] synthase II [Phycisphaerae bacterium]
MTDRRVVITGMGAITPVGADLDSSWDALVSGRCGVRALAAFDASPYSVRIGGECIDFEPDRFIDKRQAKRMDRVSQLAYVACRMTWDDSGLETGQFDPTRAGVIIGTGIGGLREIEEQHCRLIEKGPSKVSAFTIPKLMANAGAGHISIALGFQGISTTVVTACAS